VAADRNILKFPADLSEVAGESEDKVAEKFSLAISHCAKAQIYYPKG
jgi:hypothetical protein